MASDQTLPWQNEEITLNGKTVKKNFVAWFHESKICNPDGTPWIVYRGDKKDVDSFDPNKRREPGQFFCLEPERAAFYGEPKAYVIQASNVLDLRNAYAQWRKGGEAASIINSLYADYYEGHDDPESGEPYSVAEVITAIEEGFLWKLDGLGGWTMNAWRDLQRLAIASGFDAILVHDDGEGIGKGLDVVVFGANQIKSVHGNSGLFIASNSSVSDREEALNLERALKAKEAAEPASPKNHP